MQLIKLDAIESTNDFLKTMAAKSDTADFTVVTAENQTKGKGQMGAVWNSEAGKNLIVSVLVKNVLDGIDKVFNLNVAVALSVLEVLRNHNIPDLSIKWPNDIMSANKKIGGILIENTIKSDGSIYSVVGVGLNVNQTNFENLPKASSISLAKGEIFDREKLLFEIIAVLKKQTEVLKVDASGLWADYEKNLFKIKKPTAFKDKYDQHFMGIITGVDASGKLKIRVDGDTLHAFEIKEIEMLY